MKQKTRNALALIAIVIYIVITMANPDNPMIRYYALLVIGAYELILSAIYYLLNRPMKPHERIGEIIAAVIIAGAMLFVLFRFII
ncbi:MAG: hypothetical protein SCM11_19325 [Bacillota bacterium]|nr:hypothetical protein [Bacillota bacterium]